MTGYVLKPRRNSHVIIIARLSDTAFQARSNRKTSIVLLLLRFQRPRFKMEKTTKTVVEARFSNRFMKRID
jgi:hypothetical protein